MRYEAEFRRADSARMDGTEHMAKQRARRSLFPDEQVAIRHKDAEQAAVWRSLADGQRHVEETKEDLLHLV